MKTTTNIGSPVRVAFCAFVLAPLTLLAVNNRKCQSMDNDAPGCIVNAEGSGCELDQDPVYGQKCSNIEFDSTVYLCVPEPGHNCEYYSLPGNPVPWTRKFGGGCLSETTYESIKCWCDEDPAMGAETGSISNSCAT